LKGHGFTGCAEKVASRDVLKGHGFSRAVQVLSFCHPEATLVAEGSAFLTFSATSSAEPPRAAWTKGFKPLRNPISRPLAIYEMSFSCLFHLSMMMFRLARLCHLLVLFFAFLEHRRNALAAFRG